MLPSNKIVWEREGERELCFFSLGILFEFLVVPIFNAICSICELEPSILHAICIQFFGVGTSPFACYLLHFRAGVFLFTCYLQQFWSWNLAYRTPVATFGSWNLRFCMILRMEEILHQLETISNYETLYINIFFYGISHQPSGAEFVPSTIFAFMCNILDLEFSIWFAICKLLLVVGCCLLVVGSCLFCYSCCTCSCSCSCCRCCCRNS